MLRLLYCECKPITSCMGIVRESFWSSSSMFENSSGVFPNLFGKDLELIRNFYIRLHHLILRESFGKCSGTILELFESVLGLFGPILSPEYWNVCGEHTGTYGNIRETYGITSRSTPEQWRITGRSGQFPKVLKISKLSGAVHD